MSTLIWDRLKTYGSDALSYDNNGNLTSDGSNTYTWNARGELIGISGAVTASFRYDAFGRRRGKTVNGTERKYLYDGANAVQEINTSGNPTQHFLTGMGIDEVFVRTNGSGGAKRLPLTDALGSTHALAMTDGSFAASYAYEPYGAATISGDPVGYPFTYTGREDDGTGLYYYRARYYSPEYGRFISEDPIRFAGGLNFYGYVGGNPVSRVDPSGLSDVTYDRGTGTITVYDSQGNQVGQFPAGNNTTSTSNGPWPDGTFPYSHYVQHPESGAAGPYGSNGNFVFDVPGRTGMGIHSGRNGPESRTLGCVRTTDDATDFLRNLNQTDPLSTITVQ